MSFLSFGYLVWFPVLAAFWVGVIALGRTARGGTWWSMLVGVILTTLGFVVNVLILYGGAARWLDRDEFGPGGGLWMVVMSATGNMTNLGWLLFGVGFAMRALRASRGEDRVRDLEGIIAAQQEQLNRSGQG